MNNKVGVTHNRRQENQNLKNMKIHDIVVLKWCRTWKHEIYSLGFDDFDFRVMFMSQSRAIVAP